MNKDYLSIGEFSKLSGLSIKALRYYDRIGILKPEYISKDSSYRYYMRKQLRLSELIMISVVLNIPLSYVKEHYIKDDRIQYESYLSYADDMLRKRIQRLSDDLQYVENMSDSLSRQEKESYDTYTPIQMKKTKYLLVPFSYDIGSMEFDKRIANVYMEYSEDYRDFDYTYGIMCYEGKKYIFLEIKNMKFINKKKDHLLMTLDKGEYLGKLSKDIKKEELPTEFYMILESLLSGKEVVYEVIKKC